MGIAPAFARRFGRRLTRAWAGPGLALLFVLPAFMPEAARAAPITAAAKGGIFITPDISPKTLSPEASAPPPPNASAQERGIPWNDDENALVPALHGQPGEAESDLYPAVNFASGKGGWRLPIVQSQSYLSGQTANDPAFLTGSLPLDPDKPFDIQPLLEQSEEFLAVRSLLDQGLDPQNIGNDRPEAGLSAWPDNRGWPTFGPGNDGRPRQRGNESPSFSALAIDILNPTDTQRELVRKTLAELKNYIAVAQPNTQDMILQDPADVSPVTVEFKPQGAASQSGEDDPYATADAGSDDTGGAGMGDASHVTTQEYTRIFSFNSIWEFMTSVVMISFYILIIALWAAWHYVIRRFV